MLDKYKTRYTCYLNLVLNKLSLIHLDTYMYCTVLINRTQYMNSYEASFPNNLVRGVIVDLLL